MGSASADAEASNVTRVVVLSQRGARTHVVPDGATFTIGRQKDCEIVVDLPSVSRRHARVTGGDRPMLEDLGGMNGVRVGGRRIPVGTKVPLRGGDVIEMGGAIAIVRPPREIGAARLEPHSVPGQDQDPMEVVEQLVDLVAQSELSVLLVGESGVGKSATAETIHARSARARGPLLVFACASLPEPLLERELFGDAPAAKVGLLETASGGTVVLDDIGDLSLAVQGKLALVMESREVVPLGGTQAHRIDVRFIATTHRDLLARARKGAFRLDLHERLSEIAILIPPLRERPREIAELAQRFLASACARKGKRAPPITREALGVLMRQPYLGNMRELRSTMERAALLARGGEIRPEHLVFESAPPAPATMQTLPPSAPSSSFPPAPSFARTAVTPSLPRAPPPVRIHDDANVSERDRIVRALEECNGNQTRAAAMLGMSRRMLSARIDQYGLPRPKKR